jgi:hypothetical protein
MKINTKNTPYLHNLDSLIHDYGACGDLAKKQDRRGLRGTG